MKKITLEKNNASFILIANREINLKSSVYPFF